MVKSASGKEDMRSFTVVDVRKSDGTPTKFPKDNRFVNKIPAQAARKMGNKLCNMKRVKGQCSFLMQVQETTQGSDSKTFAYTFRRVKLDEPVVVGDRKYFYTSKVYATKSGSKFSKSNTGVATPGRMVKSSRRTNTVNNDQPKYKKSKSSTKAKKTKKADKSFFNKLFS